MQLTWTQVEKGHTQAGLPVLDFLVLHSRSRLNEGRDVKGFVAPASLALPVARLSASARSVAAQSKQ